MLKSILTSMLVTSTLVLSFAASASEKSFDNSVQYSAAKVRELIDYSTIVNAKQFANEQNATKWWIEENRQYWRNERIKQTRKS